MGAVWGEERAVARNARLGEGESALARRLADEGLLEAIYRAVEPAHPEEGCGFVFEDSEGRLSVVPTLNRATRLHEMDPVAYPRDGRTYFEPDMKPWLRAAREGLEPRVIFHSHPDTEAYFSDTDMAQAVFEADDRVVERNPGVVHLVVSVRRGLPDTEPRARVARLYGFAHSVGDFRRLATYDEVGKLVTDLDFTEGSRAGDLGR
jgi:[CysO sulfur-carrier protein]-S-L-cysteine hydrolase